MAVSPMSGVTDFVTVSVKLGGKAIDDTVSILSITISKSINQVATAELQLFIPHDSDLVTPFSLARDEDYALGEAIEISLGYDTKEKSVFEGIIVAQQFRGDATGNTLTLKCNHKAIQLTKELSTVTWSDKKDTDVILEVISEAGLSGEVESTGEQENLIVQFQSTAWDFIQQRASGHGLITYTEEDKIFVKKPLQSGVADLVLTYGKDVISYELMQGESSTKKGSLTFVGNATPKLNTKIQLAGFGKSYSGDVLITAVQHEVKDGAWQTSVDFNDIGTSDSGADSANLALPEVSGLQPGIVEEIEDDPDKELRILVNVPGIGGKLWARWSTSYATNNKGIFFVPEVGDEVVIGFVNDDPRDTIVLGSLYSSKNPPPYTADAENTIKAIVSKNDLKIEFNDKDKILTLETPVGNKFVLSDKDKSITTQDQNGNKVVMNNAGISIESAKDITIKAAGKIDISANQAITTKSSGGDIAVQGLNVNLKAQVALSAQGSASAELKASGQTTVKGAMVMIN